MKGNRDLHNALKVEVVDSAFGGINASLLKLQWGKDDVGFSVHVSPSSYTLSGLQLTDVLGFVGLARTSCPYFHGSGYCGWVKEGFDVKAFANAVASAHDALLKAERHFQACGMKLPQPEGWSHFSGRESRSYQSSRDSVFGDAHTSPKHSHLKESEDENFYFSFSWIEGGRDKGWVTHIREKHAPLSSDIRAAFHLLDLHSFEQCPEFHFERCYWRFYPSASRDILRANSVHAVFDALVNNFSLGLAFLLKAQALMVAFGFSILPITQLEIEKNIELDISTKVEVQERNASSRMPTRFDVAISFAGVNREQAQYLATEVKKAGFVVFYDHFYPEELWGKDLVVFFDEIYRKRSRYCAVFVSRDYVDKEWTNLERKSAQARALAEKGADYILPIKMDDTELPGMPPTVAYVDYRSLGIEEISRLLIRKLEGA
ncbi:MAG TPA: TIR domain-containing protein [Fimbriimonadaceae bacterium]|jgi:hypothetical protein